MSGHIFFADRYYGFDDALYARLRLLNIVGASGSEPGRRCAIGLPQPVNTPELRFDCADERKFAVIDEVKARLQKAGANVNDIDGVRVLDRRRLVAAARLQHPGRAGGALREPPTRPGWSG